MAKHRKCGHFFLKEGCEECMQAIETGLPSVPAECLADKHTGMRIDHSGILGRIAGGCRVRQDQRWCLGEMDKHLVEMATRFYGGDIKAVDEFLQLYCLDEKRPTPKPETTAGQKDGGIWICHTCKTVIGPIIDDDENRCGCDEYDFRYSRYIPDLSQDKEIQELKDKVAELEQNICDECSPDDYGWKHNRVDGKHPCTCITESGAYQELLAEVKRLRKGEGGTCG